LAYHSATKIFWTIISACVLFIVVDSHTRIGVGGDVPLSPAVPPVFR
jgi:hypothetical protein